MVNEQKEQMIKWLQFQILQMDQYCKLNQIDNKMIADKCGLPKSYVWKFRNKRPKEMTLVNFLLISKAIGYEFHFKR